MEQATFFSALNSESSTAPEWVELLPAADAESMIVGRDGRQWLWDNEAQKSVLAQFRARDIDLVVDWNHSTQLSAAVNGGEAPAAGWVKDLEIRNGALWGMVEWTQRAAQQITERAYRFLSPVFDYADKTLRIGRMATVGLTNTPNLNLTALNKEEAARQSSEAASQSVPQSNYDALMQRALNAERALAARAAIAQSKEVDDAIHTALRAGKITPATAGFFRSTCSEAGGLERFRQFVAVAVELCGDSSLGRLPTSFRSSLNSEESAVARMLGQSEAEFLAEKARSGNQSKNSI